MAAKVAMVAVPTVLGIASIRVYTVSEEPADGLVSREKLNVYTPVQQSARAEIFVEQPGLIQNGLTAARETIQPYVLAVKGACSSVKRGSVRLYHTGEDLFYYLKDPPPEFLPRFGTITMAGLLGMFMARKGSRFKRVALPLGLMSAGASVCYPAQAVAVVKVTGKKVYAVGQWSSTAVSSLLTAKPQEPVTKDSASSQSQAAPVPNPESAVSKEAAVAESASSSTVPETEVSAESSPVLDEPAVLSEEASSVTAAEISSAQTPTDIDPVEDSVSAETKNFTASEEIPAPDKSEELSDIKQGVEDVSAHASTAESTPSSESETASVEVGPPQAPFVVAEPVEAAPAVSTQVESIPSSEESSAPAVANQPSVPVVESAEPLPELTDLPPVAAMEKTPTTAPTTPTPPPEQPAAENNKGGSGFKSDPALMDFGQSSPEDEDLYSTRS